MEPGVEVRDVAEEGGDGDGDGSSASGGLGGWEVVKEHDTKPGGQQTTSSCFQMKCNTEEKLAECKRFCMKEAKYSCFIEASGTAYFRTEDLAKCRSSKSKSSSLTLHLPPDLSEKDKAALEAAKAAAAWTGDAAPTVGARVRVGDSKHAKFNLDCEIKEIVADGTSFKVEFDDFVTETLTEAQVKPPPKIKAPKQAVQQVGPTAEQRVKMAQVMSEKWWRVAVKSEFEEASSAYITRSYMAGIKQTEHNTPADTAAAVTEKAALEKTAGFPQASTKGFLLFGGPSK